MQGEEEEVQEEEVVVGEVEGEIGKEEDRTIIPYSRKLSRV